MPIAMVKKAERLARRERLTMSGLFREALSNYEASRKSTGLDWNDDTAVDACIQRIIHETKRNPMSKQELEAEAKELAKYGARQAKKLGIKERDAVRIIHEFRARRNPS